MKLDHNIAECLYEQQHFFGQTVHNVCSGTEVYIPYGGLQVLMAGLGLTFGVAVVSLVLLAVLVIITS